MKLLTIFYTLTFSLLALPGEAKNINRQQLLDSTNITQVSESLISKGIAAYQKGNYDRAAWLFETFLSPRKVVLTPTEKEGLRCLALAYQKLGRSDLVARTVRRLRSSVDLPATRSSISPQYYGYRCL